MVLRARRGGDGSFLRSRQAGPPRRSWKMLPFARSCRKTCAAAATIAGATASRRKNACTISTACTRRPWVAQKRRGAGEGGAQQRKAALSEKGEAPQKKPAE